MLQLRLTRIAAREAAVQKIDARVEVAPFRPVGERLITIPGMSHVVARVLETEIGPDLSRFPTAGHLVSWWVCVPGCTREPAGGSPPACARAPWLKTAVVQAAWTAVRTKGSYLQVQLLDLKSRHSRKSHQRRGLSVR